MYKKFTLKNGANVIFVPQNDTKSVTSLIMFPVGSRYEPEHLAGVSHYIEHVMFKGTSKRPNTLALTREIDRLGAQYNAFTGKEYTGYYIKTDADYTEIALDILSDMLFGSLFDPEEMEREKGPIIEELRMYNDNPLMNIDNIFEDLLYEGCPLGRDIGGTIEHVKSYKREEVLEFKAKHYQPKNLTLVISGKIGDDTEELVAKYFGEEENSAEVTGEFLPFTFGAAEKEKRVALQKKKTDQAQLMLGFPGFSYTDENNPTIAVLNTILGGSMSSRLFIEIRERRGLAYMIRSGRDAFRDTGYIYIRAGLDPKNIPEAMQVIRKEIQKLFEEGITDEELSDAKTHVRGAFTLAQEDSSFGANWYAKEALFSEEIKNPDDYIKLIEKVTKDEVMDIVKQVFDFDKMRIAVIGDTEEEELLKLL